MTPSIRSHRLWPRALSLLLAISLCVHVYTIAALASSENDLSHRNLLNRGWWNVLGKAQELLSIPQNDGASDTDTDTEQRPLASDSNRERMNATFVSLVRNTDLPGLLNSIRDVEDRFNRDWHYDWVFLNEKDFSDEFKLLTTAATSGRARYGKVDEQHWSIPDFIDPHKAQMVRQDSKEVKYGDSASYRHMCRYQSGFFYRHPLVQEYEWYWRVEPDIQIFCDIPYDPFRWMAENRKQYGFVLSFNELKNTVPTLWDHVNGFMQAYPQHISPDNHYYFITEDGGQTSNYCHFWSNFEIANLEWFRSEAYNDFFNYLDKAGGFFYERWGDASVHSIAAALMLNKGEIHFFDDIGYRHEPYTNCPKNPQTLLDRNCRCSIEDNLEWSPSCLKRFFEVSKLPFPDSYDRDVPPEVGRLE